MYISTMIVARKGVKVIQGNKGKGDGYHCQVIVRHQRIQSGGIIVWREQREPGERQWAVRQKEESDIGIEKIRRMRNRNKVVRTGVVYLVLL